MTPETPSSSDTPSRRAPTTAVWDVLTPAEREQVVASLPIVVEHDFMSEGDLHAQVVLDTSDMLRARFGGGGPGSRRLYLGKSVMVYYPAAPSFAPDLFAVLDVDDHPRDSWVVSAEGKGLDVALEVHWKGSVKKDFKDNVISYAAHGIPEYFILDRTRMRILGYRLPPGGGRYQPILPQGGRFQSHVLGLWLAVDGQRFRFLDGNQALPTKGETIERLDQALQQAEEAAQAEAARAESEATRAESEATRAESEATRAESEATRAESEAARADSEAARANAESLARERLEEQVAELQRRLAALSPTNEG